VAKEPAAADPLIGTVVGGRYRIDARIGAGGMAVVYRATQSNVGRAVAIKVLNASVTEKPSLVARFEVEARVISRLRHPNTIKLFDVGRTEDGRLFIVTELLEGEPLHRLIKRGELSPMRAIRIVSQVAESLAEAHAAGIVHRDLKPQNLIVDDVGGRDVAKVLDFGIAKLMDGPRQTVVGDVFGTPAYMSPEQAQGKPVNATADVYSLGVILYECLAGELPFEGTEAVVILEQHIHDAPKPLSTLRNAVRLPPELEDLVMQMLAKRPEERIASMDDVRNRLRRIELTMEREAAFEDEAPTRHVTIEPGALRSVPPAALAPKRSVSPLILAAMLGLSAGAAAVAAAMLLR
jgi:serine/threonine-protein kinase